MSIVFLFPSIGKSFNQVGFGDNAYRRVWIRGDGIGTCAISPLGVNLFMKVVRWYRKAAEKGNVEAQRILGACYDDGDGVEKSPKDAVYWYRKAAEEGDPEAENSLGNCYEKGEGVEQSYDMAIYWYKKSAAQGHVMAQYNLVLAYYYGTGVEKDIQEARRWLELSSKQGFNLASRMLLKL